MMLTSSLLRTIESGIGMLLGRNAEQQDGKMNAAGILNVATPLQT